LSESSKLRILKKEMPVNITIAYAVKSGISWLVAGSSVVG